MTNYNEQKFIKLLKPGCTPGIDGITTEHLSNGLKTSLPLYLSALFSVCLKYGIVPNDFCVGPLVPILKKNTLDPNVPKNYRPITISVIMSKTLEHFILEKCGDGTYNDTSMDLFQIEEQIWQQLLLHTMLVLTVQHLDLLHSYVSSMQRVLLTICHTV